MSAFNGAGTFVISGVGLPFVTGTTISSTVANQLNNDLAAGLTNCITKDGQSTPIANIPMGGFKLTGLGVATAPGDALSFGNPATFGDPVRINGKLGINMVPVNVLDVTHNQNAPSGISLVNSDPGATARAGISVGNGPNVGQLIQFGTGYTTSAYFRANGTLLFGDGSGGLTLAATIAQPIYFVTNSSERMRLDAVGNLGIGMTPVNVVDILNPNNGQANLNLYNPNNAVGSCAAMTVQAAGGHATFIRQHAAGFTSVFPSLADGGLLYGNGNSGLTICTGQAAPIKFGINNVEKGQIDVAGHFIWGGFGNWATAQAEFAGPNNVLSAYCTNTAGAALLCRVNDVTPTLATFFYNATVVGSITTNSVATAYNTASDHRLKNVGGDFMASGAIIDALRPRFGTWIANGAPFIGFIADEVQLALSDTVRGVKDEVDGGGLPIYQQMAYGSPELITCIIAELKSVRARLLAGGL